MTLQDLKDEFDRELAKLSNQDIVDAFAEMGCVVEIVPPQSEGWIYFDEIHSQFSTRPSTEPVVCDGLLSAADSNELALAA